jgi:hypothetical protein
MELINFTFSIHQTRSSIILSLLSALKRAESTFLPEGSDRMGVAYLKRTPDQAKGTALLTRALFM